MVFASGLPLQLAVGGILVAGLFASGFGAGYKVRDGAAAREREAAVVAQMGETLDEIERGQGISAELEVKNRRIRGLERQLAGAIDVLPRCHHDRWLTADFVRVHDAAATGTLPEASSGVACAPSTINEITAAHTVVANYSRCNEYIQQLEALIRFEEGR